MEPGNMKLENRNLFNKLARYYDFPIFKKWLVGIQNKALEIVKIRKGKVLDVGCGTGNFLLKLSRNKNLELYGIDISERMLETAREKLGNKADLRLISAEKMKDKNKFDYIFSFEAFHHFSDKNKAVKNFYNSLKKRGMLVIVDINFGFLNRLFEKIEPGNTGMLNSLQIKNIFKANNFKNIKQEKIGLFVNLTSGRKSRK